MTVAAKIDPVAFKRSQRDEWESAAPGWYRWHEVLEAPAAGQAQTRRLLDVAGIGPGDTVLDVATGCGEPGLTAAHVVQPAGRVVCTDISGEMLVFARLRAEQAGLDNVEFVEADAEELDFAEESFDAVLCRHGLQFLIGVGGALRRYRSFLRRDGRLAAIVWGPPAKVQFSLAMSVILRELALPPPPAGLPGIFALADADALARLVTGAGFRDVETGSLAVVYETQNPAEFTQLVREISPPISKLVEGQPPEVSEQVWRKVTEAWAPMTSGGRTRIGCEAIWVAGTR